MNTAQAAARKKRTWSKAISALVTVITIASGGLAVKDYFDHRARYDLSGRWIVENTVEQTSYRPFKNMKSTFTVSFTQNGTEFTGVGEKSTINGRPVSGRDHTPLKVEGSIEGRKIHATFTETGVERETSGDFDWEISTNGKRCTGNFHSTAAATSGPSIMRRL